PAGCMSSTRSRWSNPPNGAPPYLGRMHFRPSPRVASGALPAIAAAAPFAVFALRILIHHRDPVFSGDPALLDMATRSAAHFHRQVGPYSRYGFSHPGPALFYAAAPVLLATSDAPWTLI